MASEVVVRAARVIPVTDAKRPGEFDTVVVYMVAGDPLQVHTLSIPGKGLTETQIQSAIREDMTKRGRIEGMKFTV